MIAASGPRWGMGSRVIVLLMVKDKRGMLNMLLCRKCRILSAFELSTVRTRAGFLVECERNQQQTASSAYEDVPFHDNTITEKLFLNTIWRMCKLYFYDDGLCFITTFSHKNTAVKSFEKSLTLSQIWHPAFHYLYNAKYGNSIFLEKSMNLIFYFWKSLTF